MTLRDKLGMGSKDAGHHSSSADAAKNDGLRHGSAESTGADSYRSTDTVKGASSRGTPVAVDTNKQYVFNLVLYHLHMRWIQPPLGFFHA